MLRIEDTDTHRLSCRGVVDRVEVSSELGFHVDITRVEGRRG